MNIKIDIKSALFGMGVGVVGMLVMAAASPSAPVGRFQITGTAGHGLVLDTATGEVWSGFFPADRGGTAPDFMKPKNGQR